MNKIFSNQIKNHRIWEVSIFTLLTSLSILNGQTTIFYLINFFWWSEFLRIIIDDLFSPYNENAVIVNPQNDSLMGSLFQMGIYYIFIVVFFGLITNFNNTDLLITNMSILLFKNWYFNLNLIYLIIERVLIHQSKQKLEIYSGIFTPNMIVLHISIILGALILFFVVKKYPDTFTPSNLWGSLLIILPFLLLRIVMQYLNTDGSTTEETKK